MSTNDYILHKKNSSDDWEEKILVPESGKVVGFDASLNPVMVTPATSNPLMPYDYWAENFFSNNSNVQSTLRGASLGSGGGYNNTYMHSTFDSYYPLGQTLTGWLNANTGYVYSTNMYNGVPYAFGTTTRKIQCVLKLFSPSANINRIRIGFGNTVNTFDPWNGVYFNLIGTSIVCTVRKNNADVYSQTMSTTLVDTDVYLYDIDVNSSGTSISFKLINPTNNNLVEEKIATVNVADINSLNFFILGFRTTTASGATNICTLHYFGHGTLAGYNRARG